LPVNKIPKIAACEDAAAGTKERERERERERRDDDAHILKTAYSSCSGTPVDPGGAEAGEQAPGRSAAERGFEGVHYRYRGATYSRDAVALVSLLAIHD